MSALTKELSKAGGAGRGADKTRGPKRGSHDGPTKGPNVSHSTEGMLFTQQLLIGHQVRVQVGLRPLLLILIPVLWHYHQRPSQGLCRQVASGIPFLVLMHARSGVAGQERG